MSRKDILLKLCNFQKADRVLVDYIAHSDTDIRLKKYFGIDSEMKLLDILGSDFYYLSGRDISQNEGFSKFYKGKKLEYTESERICPLGIRWSTGAYDHKFSVDEAICGPLENAQTEKDILQYKLPCTKDFDFSLLLSEIENNDRIIVGGLWSGIMGDSYRMHGFQNFLMNMALKPVMIKTLINKMTDMYLELNDAIFNQLKGKIDIYFFGNDFGSQSSLLFSTDMWYEFFFDNVKKLTTLAHNYGLKVMMHSCGAISQIIPGLIDAGVDILDPIQVTAAGMDIETLSQEYGGQIVFHGGIDTQKVLPFSSTLEVENHVRKTLEIFDSKGGYIFSPSQLLGADIPIENIIAMYKAVMK